MTNHFAKQLSNLIQMLITLEGGSMWLAASLVMLAFVLGMLYHAFRTSPEATDLTYQIVKAALKSVSWFNRHQMTLIGINRVMITNKYSNIKMMKYKVYVRIENGYVIVSNFCRHGIMESKTSLAHVDAIKKLGVAIETVIDKHLEEGCGVYEPNYDF